MLLLISFTLAFAFASAQPATDRHDFGAGSDGHTPYTGVTFDTSGNMYGTTLSGGAYGKGTVWEITSSGTYIDLHDFGAGTDGQNVTSNVAIDSSGNLFGIAGSGGTDGNGMVWEITSARTYIDLHDFGAAPDGRGPNGVTLYSGNLYGTTEYGGANSDSGTVWKISGGTYSRLRDFGGAFDFGAQVLYGNVSFDSVGNMYGTTVFGGAYNQGLVWEISNGILVDLHDFGGIGDGTTPEGSVTIDASGNLYGTASLGGPYGGGNVWVISSGTYTDLHDFGLGADGENPSYDVTLDFFGNLYGTSPAGGAHGRGTVWEFTTSGTYSDVHDFAGGTDGQYPQGNVTFDIYGNMFGTTKEGGTNGPGMVWEISPGVASMTLTPNKVVGGGSSSGSLTLNYTAPLPGVFVSLSSDSSSATPSPLVPVLAGTNSGTFTVSTTAVATDTTANIKGTFGSNSLSAPLTITAPTIVSVTLAPTTVVGGVSSTGYVTISSPAPSSGITVNLAVTSGHSPIPAFAPTSVTIAAGATKSPNFTVTTLAVPNDTSAVVTGTLNSSSAQATLAITAPTLVSMTLSPTTVAGSTSSTGYVTLSSPAPVGGITVYLAATSGYSPVPASPPTAVTVACGATQSPNFTVTTLAVLTDTSAVVKATLNASNAQATLAITAPTLVCVTLAPTTVAGGTSSTGYVKLSSPAPVGGITVNLAVTSGYSPMPASVPTSITVASGATQSPNFTVTTLAVLTDTSAVVKGTLNSSHAQATQTITAPKVSSVTLTPATVAGGTSSTGYVTLSSPAPVGGITVNLAVTSGYSPMPASGPTSVIVASGQIQSPNFTVTTLAVLTDTSAVVKGTLNSSNASALLTITAPTIVSVTLAPTSVLGTVPSTGYVKISSPAPVGGITVNLAITSGSSPVPAFGPSSVIVAAGQTQSPNFTLTTIAVPTTETACVKGTLNSSNASATLTVTPPAIVSVSVNPTSVYGTVSSTGLVTISGPAPTGGINVAISSNIAFANVTSPVTVLAGQTTANFPITTLPVSSNQTATIKGTLNGTQTATLTIIPAILNGLTIAVTEVIGGNSTTGTVTLNYPAGPSGTVVNLSSTTGAGVPATVTIPANATSAPFTITSSVVGFTSTATITATEAGHTYTATLTINPAALTSLTLNPNAVVGGVSTTGTVTLYSPAPSPNGSVVNLSSNNANAVVPATVTVLSGATSANFTITTSAVTSNVTATISAAQGHFTLQAPLQIQPPLLSAVTVSPGSVIGGNSSSGTVVLARAATGGGVTVNLSSSNNCVVIPASVTVPAGSYSVNFTVTTRGVTNAINATITATLGPTTKTAPLTVNPAGLTAVSVSPTSVVGGISSTGTVTLSGAAPSAGLTINLSSNSLSAVVPTSVFVASGLTSTTFTITTTGVSSNVTATISATQGATTMTALLTVTSAGLASVTVAPTSVQGCTSSIGTVTLSSNAPAGGVTVSLSSNSLSATVPLSVLVLAGTNTITFTVRTSAVSSAVSATITGTLGGQTRTALLTITPATLASVSVLPTSVVGGTASTGTVTLSGPAGPGGAVVGLSSNSSYATVLGTVTVAAGHTSNTFTVNTTTVPSTQVATITGTLAAVTQTAALTIQPTGLISVSLLPTTVIGGNSSVGTVTLGSPAGAGGVVISLSSSSLFAVVLPTVTVPLGATSATFTVTTLGVASAVSATITATQGATSITAILTINAASLQSLTLNPTSVIGGSSSTGTVTLSSPAPAGGLTISLSSSAGAGVPSFVTVLAGSTTASFTVTSSFTAASTSASITATQGSASLTATLSIYVATLSGLTVSPSVVTGGVAATGTVTLSAPAPAGGSVVNLASSSPCAGVPATVTVPQGATSVTFTITTTAVAQGVSVTITATQGHTTITAGLYVAST